jgi:acetylornithine deacetylase/succinyl-diaminopimelate desuccinylase-like protein
MVMTRKEFLKATGTAALAAPFASALGKQAARLGFFAFLDEPKAFAADVLESAEIKKIHAYIDAHRDEHVRKIQEFLRQPSVSSWNLGMKECAEILVGYFRQLGCQEANLVPTDGYPGVWAYYNAGAKKTISRYFMYDTQPYEEKAWSSPPLAANVVPFPPFPSAIIARGAINSKGPLRAFLNALESIQAVTGKLPVNIMFTCDGEEEQGSPHFHQVLEPYLDRLQTCSAHLNPDPSQNREGQVSMALGNKGILYFELEASGQRWGRGPQRMPIHSSRKAILDSPVWRLVDALQTLYDQKTNRILVEGYHDAIAPPTQEEEALLATLLAKFKDRAFASERENVKAWLQDWSDEQAIRHLTFDTTMNIDGLWGGYTGPGVATILPERATCKIDSRLVPNQTIKDQAALVRRHLDRNGYEDIEMRLLGGGDEWSRTSVKAPAVQAVLSVYKRYGIEPAIWPRSAGSSPQAQYTRPPLNLPAVSGGLGHGGRAHAVDEYFVIEGNDKVGGLAECEKSMVDILYAFANWPD